MQPKSIAILAAICCAEAGFAGDLTPPAGPVAPTMKTLVEVEPRVTVNTLPAGVDSVHLIDQPGSYYLTSNLAGVAGMSGIRIGAEGVTLDLNGFRLEGVAGSEHGIVVGAFQAITIRNGTIDGFGMNGIEATSTQVCVVESIICRFNSEIGIAVGTDARVTNCSAWTNFNGGILTGAAGLVTGCVSSENGGHGFDLNRGTAAFDCIASDNNGAGFTCVEEANINRCTARDNVLRGLDGGANTTVRDSLFAEDFLGGIYLGSGCQVLDNHCVENSGPGIRVNARSTVRGNTCDRNGDNLIDGPGILVEGQRNHIHGNTLSGNTTGLQVTSASSVITSNIAHGNDTNYDILVGNDAAPISTAAAAVSPLANIEQ